MKNISSALVAAKRAFKPALKDKKNPFFNSLYADLASCIEAVNDALLENGIFMFQESTADEKGITVETVFIHETGEQLRCGKLHVPAAKQDPQAYGSAMSYARRYSLMSACGIASEDDDGNGATYSAPQKQERDETVYNIKPKTNTSGEIDPASAGEILVHFGKNKGKKLSELSSSSLSWYAEEWEAKSDQDKIVKTAAVALYKDQEDNIPF